MKGPLRNYRIVDFGWVAAGPILGCMLADMGAEVIKVETNKRPDTSRYSPDNVSRDPEKDPWFHCMNRGKMGITVDLTRRKGSDLLKKLIKISDAVIENFSPGVMKRNGLDYESLKKIKSDIVMISLSAAGQNGPLSGTVTYGPSLNGIAGVDSMIGYAEEGVLGMQQPYADYIAGIKGAFALLAALRHRKQTRQGQYIDMAQLEALISVFPRGFLDFFMNGRVPETLGNTHSIMVPHNNYQCRGKDKWISIAVRSESEWENLCRAMGDPPWTKDKRFADMHRRWENREELDRLITAWTIIHDDYEAMELLQNTGVAAMPCMDTEARYFNPHFREREMFLEITHPLSGAFVVTNTPWKLIKNPGKPERGAPRFGEHNDYVFRDLLGLSKEEIVLLEEEKVIC